MIILGVIVFCAFSCEALAGFGGTLLALAMGSAVRPLQELLAILVPANMVLSLGMVLRHSGAIDRPLLLKRIVPAMLLGLPLGILVNHLAGRALVPVFAVVVVALAVVSFLPPRGRASSFWLFLAGIVHGAYGTGGPLVVFVTARELEDKQAIRSTLASLWLSLNAILFVTFAVSGRVTRDTLLTSLILVPVTAAALFVGELLAARISNRPFRVLGAALLGAAGILLFWRGT